MNISGDYCGFLSGALRLSKRHFGGAVLQLISKKAFETKSASLHCQHATPK